MSVAFLPNEDGCSLVHKFALQSILCRFLLLIMLRKISWFDKAPLSAVARLIVATLWHFSTSIRTFQRRSVQKNFKCVFNLNKTKCGGNVAQRPCVYLISFQRSFDFWKKNSYTVGPVIRKIWNRKYHKVLFAAKNTHFDTQFSNKRKQCIRVASTQAFRPMYSLV